MVPSFVQFLRCPFCGGEFKFVESEQAGEQRQSGVLACYCGEYPVVDGIPILKKGSIGSTGQTATEVVKLIKDGRYQEALVAMLLPPPPSVAAQAPPKVQALENWKKRAEASLARSKGEVAFSEILDFYFNDSGVNAGVNVRNDYYYMVFRFAQPRHLVPIALATLIQKPQKPVLELGCGCGHITRSLIARAENQSVIGLDRNFFQLYVAKNWVAPQAQYVFADADVGLPFANGTFSTAFSSDAFHWFTNKRTCFRELERLTQDDGVIILATIRNALVDGNLYPGTLPVDGYKDLAEGIPHVLVANTDILDRYLSKQGPELAASAEPNRLANEPWLSMVASHRPETFREYGRFEDWPHAIGSLDLNPLYVKERGDKGNTHLRRVFPSAWYERENSDYRHGSYLPESISIKNGVLADLAQGKRTAEVETLIEQCVVVGLPDRYLPKGFSHTAEEPFRDLEEIGGSFYIDKIRISDLIAALIPQGDAFILVDDNKWGIGKSIAGRRAIPFLEHEGEYWGLPPDDETAISELERLRLSGANFMVIGWPAIWWLDYYVELRRHLYANARCVLQSDNLVVFNLKS